MGRWGCFLNGLGPSSGGVDPSSHAQTWAQGERKSWLDADPDEPPGPGVSGSNHLPADSNFGDPLEKRTCSRSQDPLRLDVFLVAGAYDPPDSLDAYNGKRSGTPLVRKSEDDQREHMSEIGCGSQKLIENPIQR